MCFGRPRTSNTAPYFYGYPLYPLETYEKHITNKANIAPKGDLRNV